MRLVHVKLADTGEAVAGSRPRRRPGERRRSVDLIWINGENSPR